MSEGHSLEGFKPIESADADILEAYADSKLGFEPTPNAVTIDSPEAEAAFERDGVVVRADILKPGAWGGWELIEVKNSLGVKPYQVRDVASQYWVLQGNPVCISSAMIRHVDRRVTATGLTRSSIGFVDVDVTSKAQSLVPWRVVVIAAARDTLTGPEPDVRPGPHCLRPRCEFREHCGASLPMRCSDVLLH